MKKLTKKLMDKERPLKIYLSDIKEYEADSTNIYIHLARSKKAPVWLVFACKHDNQGNICRDYGICCIGDDLNFNNTLSLLVDFAYEVIIEKKYYEDL